MSYLERGLMQQVDKIILDADPKELAELQKIDIKTQLVQLEKAEKEHLDRVKSLSKHYAPKHG